METMPTKPMFHVKHRRCPGCGKTVPRANWLCELCSDPTARRYATLLAERYGATPEHLNDWYEHP